jgi:ubiquinone/menaquinone biosynthesis C-methylase UbiE
MPAEATVIQFSRRIASRLKALLGVGPAMSKFQRAQYKQVWNLQAHTEDGAKLGVAGYTDEERLRQTAEETRNMLIDCVGIRSDDRVLEIGAGVGRVGEVLAPLCKEWIGADVSENMLEHLRRRLKDLPNVRTVALSGYDLAPIASETLDLVYCTVVFMHLDEWDRFNYIREGYRVLKPGGRMLVDNFNLLSEEGWKLFQQHAEIEPLKRAPHLSKSSTPQELHAYFTRAGFGEIQQQGGSGFWIITHGVK